MTRRLLLMAALSALTAGCFTAKYGNGDLQCAPNHACPSGFYCADDNRCYQNGFSPDFGGASIGDMMADLAATITLAPPAPAWTCAAAGSATGSVSGSQLGVSMGGSIVNGTATAASGAMVTFGYFSSDTY